MRFSFATPDDDAELRALFRETSIAGGVTVSTRREPDFFAAPRELGEETVVIVARDPLGASAGRVVCAGSIAVRPRYVNGAARRVAYLGGLRLAASHRGRFDVLRRGYAMFRGLLPMPDVSLTFTSIATENLPALRMLMAGVRGLPRYEALGDLVTVLIDTRRDRWFARNRSKSSCPAHQLAARPAGRLLEASTDEPKTEDDSPSPFLLATSGAQFACPASGAANLFASPSKLIGQLAPARDPFESIEGIHDHRAFKQTVIERYAMPLRLARPVWNVFAPPLGRLALPPVGVTLALGFTTVPSIDEDVTAACAGLDALRPIAAARGIETLAVGFDARDPRLPAVRRRFITHAYRTRLFAVRWPDEDGTALRLDDRLIDPDVATL